MNAPSARFEEVRRAETEASAPILREYVPSDRAGVDQLFRRYFSHASADGLWRRWRWQFDDNPFARERAPKNLVIARSDQVLGYMGAVPVPVRFGGERHVALCGSAFVVEPEHRMMAPALFQRLASELPFMGSSMSRASSALFRRLGGTMVPLSRNRFTFRLRYEGAACLRVRRRLSRRLTTLVQPRWLAGIARALVPIGSPPCQRLPAEPRADGSIVPLTVFDDRYEELWARELERTPNGVERSAEYMRWRYLDCPAMTSVRLARFAPDGRMLGVVVGVLRAQSDWTGVPTAVHGEIAELMLAEPNDVDTARRLLLLVMHALDRRRVDSITATGLTSSIHPLLADLGFRRETSEDFAIGFIPPPELRTRFRPERNDEWYVSAGDGDTIFAVCVPLANHGGAGGHSHATTDRASTS